MGDLYALKVGSLKMKRNITRTAIEITLIAIIVKLFGFLKELVLAYFYGTEYIADSYLLAISLPVIFFGWLTSVALSYVPIYTKQDHNQRILYSQRVKTSLLIFSMIGIGVGQLIAPILVKLTAPGLTSYAHNLAVEYFRVSLLSLLFMPITEINLANLNCERHYVASNVVNLFFGSIQIVFIIISGLFDYHSLIWGYTVSSAVRYAASALLCSKYGLRISFVFGYDELTKRTFKLGFPMIVSQLVAQINSLIDRMLASFLTSGSIAILSYANTLKLFAYSVFTLAADTIIFPEVSRLTAKKEYHRVYGIEEQMIRLMSLILLPVTVFCCLNSKYIVYIAFFHGAFTYESLISTSNTFIAYIIGLLPISLTEILIRMFYSFDDSKSPLKISLISIALNALFSVILMRPLGINGIALATTLASFITLPIYTVFLRRKIIQLDLTNRAKYKKHIVCSFPFWIKLLVCLVAMIICYFITPQIEIEKIAFEKVLIQFIANFFISFMGFCICCFILLRKEIKNFMQFAIKSS